MADARIDDTKIAAGWEAFRASLAVWACPDCGENVASTVPGGAGSVCRACYVRRFVRFATEPERSPTLEAAGVPARVVREPFDVDRLPGGWPRHPSNDPARHAVDLAEWTGDEFPLVTFLGEIGVGKTMLASELLWRQALLERSVRFVRAASLVDAVFSRRVRRAEFVEPGALVVDDLGRGHGAPEAWATIAEVIIDRDDALAPTIVTTNLSFRHLAECHAALADRLRAGLCCRLAGESQR